MPNAASRWLRRTQGARQALVNVALAGQLQDLLLHRLLGGLGRGLVFQAEHTETPAAGCWELG